MTQEQLEEYLGLRLSQLGAATNLQPAEYKVLIRRAIEIGLDDFWHAGDWTFKQRRHAFTVSTTTNLYDLPDDFEGMVGVTDETNEGGGELIYLSNEDFKLAFPDPDYSSSSSPQVFTIYENEGVRRISFYPPPSAGTYYLEMHTKVPNNVGAIPARATAALVAVIEKYLVPIGSMARQAAEGNAMNELNKLANRDTFYAGNQTRVRDYSEYNVFPWRDWA